MTRSRYAAVPLGKALRWVAETIDVTPEGVYEPAGLYSFGRGLFRKPQVRGAETRYRVLWRLREGQFVVARLNAWEGAVAVVDPAFDGLLVSQEFPVFTVDETVLDQRYLAWLCQWPVFWESLGHGTQGSMVRRKRIHPDTVGEVQIPLPDLDEQRRVATRLGTEMARIDALSGLTRQSLQIAAGLTIALCHRPDLSPEEKRANGWRQIALGQALKPGGDVVKVRPDSSYENFGVLSFGRGVFAKPPIDGASTSARVLFRARAGQFVYSRLFAFEGAFARVPERFDGFFVSNEFPLFDCDERQVTSEFLAAWFRSPGVWTDLAQSSKGLGLRRQRVEAQTLLTLRLWVPAARDLERITRVLRQLGSAIDHTAERGKCLAALRECVLNLAFAGEL